jgi:hypothetical protein
MLGWRRLSSTRPAAESAVAKLTGLFWTATSMEDQPVGAEAGGGAAKSDQAGDARLGHPHCY